MGLIDPRVTPGSTVDTVGAFPCRYAMNRTGYERLCVSHTSMALSPR